MPQFTNSSKSPARLWLVITAGAAIAVVVFGPRSTFGLFVDPVISTRGWGRDVFALAMAIQQLVWGILQPVAGALADRYGAWKAVTLGAVLYAAGMAMMTFATSTGGFYLSAGLLIGAGLAGGGLPVIVAAVGKLAPEEKRSFALGVVTAGSSLGQFAFAPVAQTFISEFGWVIAIWLLTIPIFALPLLALPFRRSSVADFASTSGKATLDNGTAKDAMSNAFRHKSYLLLNLGFFVCGFHVAFITVHLPPYFADLNLDATLAAIALSLIGLFNVFGAVSAGILGQRFSKRNLLSTLYISRGIAIALFLMSDKSQSAVYIFAAALGLLWLSTVPLTSGLVAIMFGTRHLGVLFGFVFLSHQIGAFIGIWLGGYIYETQGSYDSMWIIAVVLAFAAALIHLPIEERSAPVHPAAQTA